MKKSKKLFACLALLSLFSSSIISCNKPVDTVEYKIFIPSVKGCDIFVSSTKVIEGGSVTLTIDPKEHFELLSVSINGNNCDVSSEGYNTTIENITENQAIDVKVKGVGVVVNFISLGEVYTTNTFEYGSAYGKLPEIDFSPIGYTFEGWYPTEQFVANDKLKATNVVNNHLEHTFYAKFNPNIYQLSFVVDGGTNPSNMNVIFDKPVGNLPTAMKFNHTFIGWEDENGKLYTKDTIYRNAKNTTLYAKFEKNQ